MLPNCVEYFGAVWGLGKLGAVSVPLNTASKGELLKYFIEQSNSEWVVVDEEWEDHLAEILPTLKKVKGCIRFGRTRAPDPVLAQGGRELVGLKSLENEKDDDLDASLVTYQDPHLIMYTSGTTGPSKGVYLPHSQCHAVGRILAKEYGYAEGDVIYTCLPLFHGNAFNYSCYPALWADATIAVSPRFSVSRFWSDIRQTGATQFNALGAMISLLLKQPPPAAQTAAVGRGQVAFGPAMHGAALVPRDLPHVQGPVRHRHHVALRDDRDLPVDIVRARRP
jgi:crotonobetaine/carnitine-CoA ligase